MKHHSQIAADRLAEAQATALVPRKGMFVRATDDSKTSILGSGWRTFIVISCGPKWIRLYYTPNLSAIQYSHKDWALIRPEEYTPNAPFLWGYITGKQKLYDQQGWDYNRADTAEALNILEKYLGPNWTSPRSSPPHDADQRRNGGQHSLSQTEPMVPAIPNGRVSGDRSLPPLVNSPKVKHGKTQSEQRNASADRAALVASGQAPKRRASSRRKRSKRSNPARKAGAT